jgi:UDP-2-acetamido-2,6-beta-L-arabino-hexul-4-ose reductase
MKIGITGEQGFVGRHLKNYLALQEGVELISFERTFFDDVTALNTFVDTCDVIVHLAGMNRHTDPQVIFDTNVALAQQLINACQNSNATPHILFASSTQEERDNEYGRSKKAARLLFETWAAQTGGQTTGMIIPNVFGPFGKPFYNSVIATFCHQIANNEQPEIQTDGDLKLVYVNDLIDDIYRLILSGGHYGSVQIAHRFEVKVSEILLILNEYKEEYLNKGNFPSIDTPLRLALFNTFRCFLPTNHFPKPFKLNIDTRGSFVEIVRTGSSGQFSYSTTKPGVTRGNHFHTRKAERFAVIHGKARIEMRKIDSDEVISYEIDGGQPAFVDMPIWHTHNITNIGNDDLLTLFWINEPYDPADPDTYFVNV